MGMNSFVIGKIVEPEKRQITQKKDSKTRNIVAFGLLSGKSCTVFEVWDGDKLFDKVAALKEGETVLAVINPSTDDKGNIKHYLNAIGSCPTGIREQLANAVK